MRRCRPTVGDQVRLADTDLWIEVERDLIAENGGYGNEVKFGGGKVIRDGMGQSPLALAGESLDLVITNALIVDAVAASSKPMSASKRAHRRHRTRRESLIQDGITMVIGAATEWSPGRAASSPPRIDSHIHFICPQQITERSPVHHDHDRGGTGPAPHHATTARPVHGISTACWKRRRNTR